MNLEIKTDPEFDTLSISINDSIISTYYNNHKVSYNYAMNPEFKEYNLRIDSDIGYATASCLMPEPFKIISPRQSIVPGNDCAFIWHKAKNAQWYRLHLVVVYNENHFFKTIETKDTSVTVEGAFFSQPNGIAEIFISAINGVELDDTNGNIKGNAIGYWLGTLTVNETLNIGK